MTTPAMLYRCGLPVAMVFMAAGGASILAGSVTVAILTARAIIGPARHHGLRTR